jgi:hypothetical protein
VLDLTVAGVTRPTGEGPLPLSFLSPTDDFSGVFRDLIQEGGMMTIRVVDPYPDWIRIQCLCGCGSVLGIRIPDPDPGVRKYRNFSGKMHLLVFFNLPLKWYKIAPTTGTF